MVKVTEECFSVRYNSWEVEARRSIVQGYPPLSSKFKASLGYMKTCHETNKKSQSPLCLLLSWIKIAPRKADGPGVSMNILNPSIWQRQEDHCVSQADHSYTQGPTSQRLTKGSRAQVVPPSPALPFCWMMVRSDICWANSVWIYQSWSGRKGSSTVAYPPLPAGVSVGGAA